MENLEFSKPGLTWNVTMIPRDYGHDRVCGKDACCEFQTGQAYSSNLLFTRNLCSVQKAFIEHFQCKRARIYAH